MPLRSLRIHEQGQLIAAGSDTGTTYLFQFSESLAVPQKNDKPLLTEVFDYILKFLVNFVMINTN